MQGSSMGCGRKNMGRNGLHGLQGLGLGTLLWMVFMGLFPFDSWADSRSHLFYPSPIPQYANQLDIDTVSMGFFGENLLVSDSRHNVIFLNITGQPFPLKKPGNDGVMMIEPGQAVVVAGNSHTSPLPEVVPHPATKVGMNPLGLTESDGVVFIADGNGTIDAVNLSPEVRNLYMIPPIGNTGALRGHFTRMLQRSGMSSGKLGLAAPLPLKPGELSVIAGGGSTLPGEKPVDAFSCRISPVAITADHGKIFIAGEAGRVYFLNESPVSVEVPVKHGIQTSWINVPTGMIMAVAGVGMDNSEIGTIPIPAVGSTLSPSAIAFHKHHLFVADSGGTIDEINIAHDHLQVAANAEDPNQVHSLDPGEVVAISGNGNDVAGEHPVPSAWVSIRPKSLTISNKGLLFLADLDHSMGAGRVLAMNVGRKQISLPFMADGSGERGISLAPGKIILIAGNSSRSPIVGTTPGDPRQVGIEPVQIAYHEGFLMIGDLLGTIDLVNMESNNRFVHPLDTHKTLSIPGGSIISLMGAGVGTDLGRGQEVP
ncbi:MAG: hypothetical protein ACYCYP_07055 [Leptospirales bacterium]